MTEQPLEEEQPQEERDKETEALYLEGLRHRIEIATDTAHLAHNEGDPDTPDLGLKAIKLLTEYRVLDMKRQGANSVGAFMGVVVEDLTQEDAMTVISTLTSLLGDAIDENEALQVH